MTTKRNPLLGTLSQIIEESKTNYELAIKEAKEDELNEIVEVVVFGEDGVDSLIANMVTESVDCPDDVKVTHTTLEAFRLGLEDDE